VHLLVKNNRKKQENTKQINAILNHHLQLSAFGFEVLMETSTKITVFWVWFSCFTNTSEESLASKTSLTSQHHIQEMICSVHKPNHSSPSEHHYRICTEWLSRHLHYEVTFLCTIGKSTRPVLTEKWGRWGLFSVCVVYSSTFIWHFKRTCYNLQD